MIAGISARTELRLMDRALIKKVEVEGERMFLPRADYFDANLPGASQTVRIASFYDAKVFVRRWVIRDKDPILKALLRGMFNSFAATDSAIRQLQQALASRGLLVMISPLLNALP